MAYFYGTGVTDLLNGTSGDDFIYGFAGADQLSGGDGIDYIYGGTGNDLSMAAGAMIGFTAKKAMMN